MKDLHTEPCLWASLATTNPPRNNLKRDKKKWKQEKQKEGSHWKGWKLTSYLTNNNNNRKQNEKERKILRFIG